MDVTDQLSWRRTNIEVEDASEGISAFQLKVHRSLCLLILILIFEGLIRKLAPNFLGVLIFFAKDFLTARLLFLCLTGERNEATDRLLKIMGGLLLALSPCIIATAVNDPLLAVFGAKQYALFPTVAVALCAAYLPNNRRHLFSLFRIIALSMFVTTLVAAAQNRLPANSWLNLSVAGEDLSGFSAGGYLRVSSTFSFVGQYCYYLNALCYCLPLYFYFNQPLRGWVAKIQIPVLVGLFIVGTFVTGSRTSVVGNAGIACAAVGLLALCGGWNAISKVIVPGIIGIVLLGLIQTQYPELFAAYQARVTGTTESSHRVEMEKRILGSLLDWTDGSLEAPPSLLGYGLGVMSNGSEKLSDYANQWRKGGFWTETDQATTFFEGGWYLVVVWYGFRFWVIAHTFRRVFKINNPEFRLIACFAWGFILVIGITGTLALQPPLAIWWWMAVGLIICLGHFDREPSEEITNA